MDILVENMGRVNFGPRMESQRKGIEGCVQLNGHMHYNWEMYTLPLDNLEKLDFTILTSISEGQPLSVLESFAARRPCVTTDVGCCRELLEGSEGDSFGRAGYYVAPMYREGLADAMEKLCVSEPRRRRMGENAQNRVKTYYKHEDMMENYRKVYREVEEKNGWNRI